MNMAAFHQAKHLARVATYLERFAIKFALERIQRSHDIGNRSIAVVFRVRRFWFLRLFPNIWISFLYYHLAEIDADEIVLEDVVIEHVFGSFTEVDDPFAKRRRFDAVR